MTIVLRDYQNEIIDSARAGFASGHRTQLIVSPTGSGKTVMFSYMAGAAKQKGLRVLIMAHRVELIEQIIRSLASFGIRHGIIAPGIPANRTESVQVASVFAMVRRIGRYQPFDLIIIDESHHCTVASSWGKVVAAYPKAKVLGVTATPIRLSGEGLGDIFKNMVLGPTVAELIDRGALSRFRFFAPSTIDTSGIKTRGGDYAKDGLAEAANKPTVTGCVISHYTKLAAGKRAVVFCVSVDHARRVAEQFRFSGIAAESIDGTMDSVSRKSLTDRFARGEVKVMTSCDIISEGYDLPAIEVAILLRPTQSLGLYLQQVGRALRIFPGKSEAIILDHAGNSARHGLPDDNREWSLEGSEKKKRARDPDYISIKSCPRCFRVSRSVAQRCECGHVFVAKPREIEQVDGVLAEIDRSVIARQARREQGSAQSLEDLIKLGASRGYKSPVFWAKKVFQSRMGKQ